MSYGLKIVEPQYGDYVHGTRLRLGATPLQPDGQWDGYVPMFESQRIKLETNSCTSYGTLNALEILIQKMYGKTVNYSDRFLAVISGTGQGGNDPHTVAETLRKRGVVAQEIWPYDSSIKTWEEYMKSPPQNVRELAKTFTYEYAFGHEWVKTDPQSMMNALTLSPLGVSVDAWNFDNIRQVYVRKGRSNHWVCIYGWQPQVGNALPYWKVFDSYDNSHKKLAFNYTFEMVKRYTLERQVISEKPWTSFIKWLTAYLKLDNYG